CPFPKKNLDYILNKHFKKENFVLDPFMGTANLGSEVIFRGGFFIGYEIEETFYKLAEENLTKML
ncbi:site-specific DNA-methyltransferase, partial [Candidatus Woesearchaeota archaeon]